MTQKPKHCGRCSGVMEPKQLGRVSAGGAALRLHLVSLPVLQCAKGHAAPVHRDFMVWLMHELRQNCLPAVPGGEAKGMLFKKYHCACGKELPAQPERSGTFAFDLAYPDTPPFKAEFEVPLYKCAGCGKEQAHSATGLAGAVPETVVSINDAAGFPHSG